MKSGDISAILNPDRFTKARAEHKSWVTKIPGMLEGKFPVEIIVDTAYVVDCRRFETGIKAYGWKIPERYDTEEAAGKGHRKWVKRIKKNSDLAVSGEIDKYGEDY